VSENSEKIDEVLTKFIWRIIDIELRFASCLSPPF